MAETDNKAVTFSAAETGHYQHCLQFLRQSDFDRYVAVLYAPEDRRPALAALYAFNAEIARIRDVVHDALPGEVRLQWWRDLINGTEHGAVTGNPVAALLLQAIQNYQLPRSVFDAYCEARIFDLYNDAMPSRNDLEGYCGETACAILQMAAMILDADAAKSSAELSGHAGVAQAVSGLLRLMPLHRRRGQVYVPEDMLQAVGVTTEQFIKGDDKAAMQRVVAVVTALAREHYAAFEKQPMPASLKAAYLPVRLVPLVLKRAERKADLVAEQGIDLSQLRRQWIYLKSSLKS
ncbi:phytoene/squalene synthase family protein [Pseudochrobactrum sp. XF203]|uniref:phytoene/squalene synthase family protein n=1 Tax=Pseudochrobactrum sp. XF203 TaxID=2879116 RepID=UPI001CE3AC5A|nr:phytoene/squalene synthase family protein [Pseudochrobactrum sp. XF203]UCA44489.1 phytoene/squalene synthase family protein [Pseudochrobactrum sp. XF203]